MKTRMNVLVGLLVGLAGVLPADQTKTEETERLQSATKVLPQTVNAPDTAIPREVLKGARCVAVVPRLLKGGFIIAGKHGRGVATCMLPNRTWSAPAFFVISGGSGGAQIGLESVDLVLLVMNNLGVRHLMQDKLQVGAEAAAAAGPIGRHAEAGVDWKVESQVLTYSRARGLFAGVDLGGTVVEHDKDSTVALYGKDFSTRALLDGEVAPPADAHAFLAEVHRITIDARDR